MPHRSMRGKLTIILVLLTCAPLLIMGLVLLYQAETHVLDQTEDRLAGTAQAVNIRLPGNIASLEPLEPGIEPVMDHLQSALDVAIKGAVGTVSRNHPQLLIGFHHISNTVFVAMRDGAEEAVTDPATWGTASINPFEAEPRFSRHPSQDGYVYSLPVIREDILVGHVIASLPTTELTQALWRMRMTIIGSLLMAISAAWWVADLLARYLLSHFFTAVQQVAAGVQTAPADLAELTPVWGFLRSLMGSSPSLATDLLNAIPLGVILYGNDLRVAFINQIYADMIGIPVEQARGMSYETLTQRIFAAEDLETRVLPEIYAGHAQIARQRQTLISGSGERIPVETVAYPFGASSSPQGVLCLVNDLRQDEDLARMRKILSFFGEAGPVGMVTVDKDGTITDFNHAMTRICNLSRENALGQRVGRLFPSLQSHLDGAREFRNKAISCPCPIWQSGPDCPCGQEGRQLVVDATITRDGRGMGTGMILIFRDITHLREMESQLHDALQQAQLLLDALDLGVVAVNNRGRISVFNQVASATTGLSADEARGEEINGLPLSPELSRLLLDSLGGGVPHRNHLVSWYIDGAKHDFIVDCSPLHDTESTIAGAMAMFRDITTLRKLEREIQRTEKLSVIGQLAAGTAHEIRNPLTTVRGFIQLLREKCRQHQWEHEVSYINLMLSEIDRINHVISEFLVLAKERPARLQTLELDRLVADISAILESEALLRGIEIHTELPEIPIPIFGDREQLKQVFLNLATNAFQAMGSSGSLRVRVLCRDDRALVEMSDTGGGIPPELLTKIFDPFFTTKDEGTGLGLAICNRIINDHHGEIHVVSTVGEGTTVTVELPMTSHQPPATSPQ